MKEAFNQWNKGDLHKEFGLQREKQCKALDEWIAKPDTGSITLNEYEQISLNFLIEY